MSDRPDRIRAALIQRLPVGQLAIPLSLSDLFGEELASYAEVIAGPGRGPIGFLTRGEGPAFTERVRVALERLALPAVARAHHLELARQFDHLRGFFKVEWHARADGIEPSAAIYFRRRPAIGDVVARFAAWGLPLDVSERAVALAAALDKDTVHFVAAAFRPDRPVEHKLYFSQWVTAATRAAVTARIARVFEIYGFARGAWAAWRGAHDHCLAADHATVFVSMSGNAGGVSPAFKIDYPDVEAEAAARWLSTAQHAGLIRDARDAVARSGTRHLTFLGVRFAPGAPDPALKLYVDLP